jgi:hypothetical protein
MIRKALLVALVAAVLVIPIAGTAQAALSFEGLLAYYPFGGNANDASANANHGTVFGATLAPDRFGNAASAYLFDGSDDYIRAVGSSPALDIQSAITLAAWVNITTLTGHSFQHIVNKSDLSSGYRLSSWQANPQGNALELYDAGGAQHIVDDLGLAVTGAWMHVAATWDGATMRIYRDGVLRNSAAFAGSIGLAANDLHIGTLPVFGGQGFFFGSIDEVAVFGRALSGAEVQALMVTSIPEPQTYALLLAGLGLLGFAARRRRK